MPDTTLRTFADFDLRQLSKSTLIELLRTIEEGRRKLYILHHMHLSLLTYGGELNGLELEGTNSVSAMGTSLFFETQRYAKELLEESLEMKRRVDLNTLSRQQLELLCRHESELSDVLIAANNTMTMRLAENGDVGDRSRAVLNEWSTFINKTIDEHGEATGRLVAAMPGQTIN